MAKKKKKSSTNKNQINIKHPPQSESTSSPATVLIAKNDTLQTKEGVKSKMAAKSKIIRSNIKQGYFDSIVNLVQKDKVNLVTDFSKQSYSSSTMK